MMSPTPAYRRRLPPSTLMQQRRFAPELSAASSMVCIWIISSSPPEFFGSLLGEALEQPGDAPPFVLAPRPRLDALHAVPDTELVLLVVRLEVDPAPHVFLVDLVRDQAFHADDHGLVHLVADDRPHLLFPRTAGFHRTLRRHVSSPSLPSSREGTSPRVPSPCAGFGSASCSRERSRRASSSGGRSRRAAPSPSGGVPPLQDPAHPLSSWTSMPLWTGMSSGSGACGPPGETPRAPWPRRRPRSRREPGQAGPRRPTPRERPSPSPSGSPPPSS